MDQQRITRVFTIEARILGEHPQGGPALRYEEDSNETGALARLAEMQHGGGAADAALLGDSAQDFELANGAEASL